MEPFGLLNPGIGSLFLSGVHAVEFTQAANVAVTIPWFVLAYTNVRRQTTVKTN